MDSTRSYRHLAFQCMKLAEAVDDPVTQDQLVQQKTPGLTQRTGSFRLLANR